MIPLIISTPIPTEEVEIEGLKCKRLARLTVEWHRARQALVLPFGWTFRDLLCDGYEVGVARNVVAETAQIHGAEFLFFLDWDVLPPPKALHRLLELAPNYPDVDVFCGNYVVKMRPPCPIIFKDDFGRGVFWDWTPGELLNEGIVGCHMGCTLLRMSVFDKITKPWFLTTNEIIGDGKLQITEDVHFYKKLKEEVGPNRIMIDTGILCSHIDPATGVKYDMPYDSLPMKRLREAQ